VRATRTIGFPKKGPAAGPALARPMQKAKSPAMSNTPLSDARLGVLLDAALAGAREVMATYATDFVVERKPDSSPVSEADRNAEAAIVARLSAAMPELPVVAEEAVSAGRIPSVGHSFMLVDPLDGTKEFISRNGEFTVNVAVVEAGAPVCGVVLAPAIGLAYAGSPDGAWRGRTDTGFETITDWQTIAVRPAGPSPVAVASRSHLTPATEAALAQANAEERRSIGSSLKFCLVAEAAADFYPRLGPTMEWDTAAGDAVLRAAGGTVVTLDGAPLRYGKTGVAGMREFENPFFLAAGDRGLLERLDLAALKSNKAA
jgi:3'(2'), 5'-bisphosphate nucleotidase